MNSSVLNDIIRRFIIYFDDRLEYIVEEHYNRLCNKFDNVNNEIRTALRNNDDNYILTLDRFKSINYEFKERYKEFLENVVDEMISDFKTMFSFKQLAKWYIDGKLLTNDI